MINHNGNPYVRYKGEKLYGNVLLSYLDEKHAEQVSQGLVVEGEEKSNYPF